eukprot:scaffold320418_cov31-Tisochrysis_lutea.AAC.1
MPRLSGSAPWTGVPSRLSRPHASLAVMATSASMCQREPAAISACTTRSGELERTPGKSGEACVALWISRFVCGIADRGCRARRRAQESGWRGEERAAEMGKPRPRKRGWREAERKARRRRSCARANSM